MSKTSSERDRHVDRKAKHDFSFSTEILCTGVLCRVDSAEERCLSGHRDSAFNSLLNASVYPENTFRGAHRLVDAVLREWSRDVISVVVEASMFTESRHTTARVCTRSCAQTKKRFSVVSTCRVRSENFSAWVWSQGFHYENMLATAKMGKQADSLDA